ncbi:MAG: hypothetical protein ACOC24_00750 [Desulfovibrionales bacterium]
MIGTFTPEQGVRITAFVQGGYYLLTGIWALVNITTFQMVTGPKTDLWLVRTVGVLVLIIGIVLGSAGVRRRFPLEVFLLALGSCLGLAAIDIIYTLSGTISPIYMLDALAELALAASWTIFWRKLPREHSAAPTH